MARGRWLAAVIGFVTIWNVCAADGQTGEPSTDAARAFEQTPESPSETSDPTATSEPSQPPKEKLARIWANEPPLVRLARDKFGEEFTETDAKFFAAVVSGSDWADFRPTPDTKYDIEDPATWLESPVIKADRITWLCTEPSASRLVPSRGIWLRGARVEGKINLYRCNIPFSLTFGECRLDNGLNIRNAKLQELSILSCCSARIEARGVQVAENVYLIKTSVFGGMDFIEAQIAGDLDMNGGRICHRVDPEELKKPGVAIDLYDSKIDGDVKLGDTFRAVGRVRLTGARIGRSLACAGGQFENVGETVIDADRAQIGRNISFSAGFKGNGCVDIRRVQIGGDLDCNGGYFNGGKNAALIADLVEIAGQLYLGDGLHAEGEVRIVNAVVAKDADCDNGHFLNPTGTALNFDSTVIGRSLRMAYDPASTSDEDKCLPPGFLARGTVRLYGTQINQDLLGGSAQFETPEGQALVATNLRVANSVVLVGVQVKGQIDLSAADIAHELNLSGSQFVGPPAYNRCAIWANGMTVGGGVNCSRIETPQQVWPFRVDGVTSFNFATIGMTWNLYGAELINPDGDALDASDCRVEGYVYLDKVTLDGRVSFSRAKIDGMWILTNVIQPERLKLDMRFAHVWVIKDEKLDDWPPAGQLQLEGFVYDHFDDDSPLSVEDRLAWLRRQYAPVKADVPPASVVRRGSPDPAETANRRSPSSDGQETFGRSTVQGQEIRAQHEWRAQQQTQTPPDSVILADFQAPLAAPAQMAPSMPTIAPNQEAPAPQMMPPPNLSEPAEEPIAPMPPPQGTDETSTVAESEVPATSSQPGMAAPADKTQATDDSDQTSENVAAAATPAAPATVIDPAGRRYITQPYTQLASVYRAIGQDEQANAVLVARAERLGELSSAFSAEGLWYRYVGRLIGYGYEPFRAIKIGVAVVAIGTIVFAIGAHRNLMAETKLAEHVLSQEGESRLVSPTYPRFNPFVYSLDVFLPFADLHQLCYWMPGERVTAPRTSRNCLMHLGPYRLKWSGILRTYLWFQTLAGWTLCTLLAAAVTGIVQS